MNSGLRFFFPGSSATATAMEYASLLELPTTNVSKVSDEAKSAVSLTGAWLLCDEASRADGLTCSTKAASSLAVVGKIVFLRGCPGWPMPAWPSSAAG